MRRARNRLEVGLFRHFSSLFRSTLGLIASLEAVEAAFLRQDQGPVKRAWDEAVMAAAMSSA